MKDEDKDVNYIMTDEDRDLNHIMKDKEKDMNHIIKYGDKDMNHDKMDEHKDMRKYTYIHCVLYIEYLQYTEEWMTYFEIGSHFEDKN